MFVSKIFFLEEYDAEVQLIITSDAKRYVNNIYRKHNINMKYKDYVAGRMVTLAMNKYYIIVDSHHLSYNTILHETLHCILGILDDRGMYEEEHKCSLMGYVSQLILSFLREKNVNIE